jgi:uncharacterized protein (DUF1015 family)
VATVLPFAGIRPQAKLAEQVAAPPYDVVNSTEARELARGNPHCFLHISKPEIDLPPETDSHDDCVYQKGRENLDCFLAESILSKDLHPCFYLYRQSIEDPKGNKAEAVQHSQTGFVGLVSADDYEADVIKKHELTRPDKENDRVRHMAALAAQTGPVFLTYQGEHALQLIMDKWSQPQPVYDFVSDGVRHQFWTVTDEDAIAQISSHFEKIPALFVADGHHRSAAAVRYRAMRREQNPQHTGKEAYNYFMAVMFPHDQLNILAYNRVVKDLGTYDKQLFLAALSADFEVTVCAQGVLPERSGSFGLYLDAQWYRLDYRAINNAAVDLVSGLDVSILQDKILSPLLGIADPRTDPRIDFIGGIKGLPALEQAVDSGEYAAAFTFFPVSIKALMQIAEQGKLMPPKSTWFEPKLKSGLILHALD